MEFIFFLKILVLLIDILNTLVCLLPIGVEPESEYNNKWNNVRVGIVCRFLNNIINSILLYFH